MTQTHLTFRDLMSRYRVSETTLHNWLRAGKFPPGIKIERTRRWDIRELEAFEQRVSTTQEGGETA